MKTVTASPLAEIALRIREMREISELTQEQMAEKTEVSLEQYQGYESGQIDLPFTFIHKCALTFGIEITDLLEGRSANLSSYTVTRRGKGQRTAQEEGIEISNLAPMFRKKIAEPYFVKYEYSAAQQTLPIHLTTHSGQEFDYIVSGHLKVQVGEHTEILEEGDSIYYNSSTPHGMIAVDGRDCLFVAVVLPGEDLSEQSIRESIASAGATENQVCNQFIETQVDENGLLQKIDFKNEDRFNFAFDIVDAIAEKDPEKLAMIHIARDKTERRFTFRQMARASSRC
ncbi:MAG: cupin domain-containing protein, partial [Clostridia bacterium]|nr:cupin domain-containing protein [Clostridia bacterium]